jgi:signal transduction histidine kinase
MSLIRRFTLVLAVAILMVMFAGGWVQWSRETRLFDEDMRHDAAFSLEILANATTRVWQTDGLSAAESLVGEVSRKSRHIIARLSEPPPGITLKAGDPAISWQTPRPSPGALVTTVMVASPPGQPPRALQIIESMGPERDYVRESLRNIIVTFLVLVLACALAGMMLGRSFIGRPTRLLVDKARRIGAGDLSSPLHLEQDDELGQVAREINAMCERLAQARDRVLAESSARVQAVEQLRHADRLSTVGKLAAGVAHELGTPLAVAAGRAQEIVDGEAPASAEARALAGIVVEQTRRMTRIIRQLLDFARRAPMRHERLKLGQLVSATIDMLAAMARKQQVELVAGGDVGEAEILGDPGQLQQIVANLVVNALQATPAGGRVELSVGSAVLAPPPEVPGGAQAMVTVSVHDTGAGMDALTRSRVFEPFFTTKDVGDGTGLGLSVAWGLARDHGGWIAVDSTIGAGTTFIIALPLAEEVTV